MKNVEAVPTREMEIILSYKDFPVGEDLPWSVYDEQRTLLLSKGTPLSSGKIVDRLLAKGPRRYINVEVPPARKELPKKIRHQPRNSFETIEHLLQRMQQAYDIVHSNSADRSFTRRIMYLVFDIQGLCDAQPDAMLGTMQLMHSALHGLVHPLHAAILCEVSCTRMGKGPLERFPIVAAALTHDLGMFEIQETLYHQKTPLSQEQEHIIKSHPRRGYDLLKRQGITEPRWLEPVLWHHERMDGSGYPDGKTGDELSFETKLMAIADCYSAMIRPRAYRSRVLPKDALKELFQERGNTIDGELANLFVNVLGIFSPGSLVELNNGEVAIVRERSKNLATPRVTVVADSKGTRLEKPRNTETDMEDTGIRGMLCPLAHSHLLEGAEQIWPKLPAMDNLL